MVPARMRAARWPPDLLQGAGLLMGQRIENVLPSIAAAIGSSAFTTGPCNAFRHARPSSILTSQPLIAAFIAAALSGSWKVSRMI